MYNNSLFTTDTLVLKINFLRQQLAKLPYGNIVSRKKNDKTYESVVIYPNSSLDILKRIERSTKTLEGKQYFNQINLRREYEAELKELEELWNKIYKIPVPKIKLNNIKSDFSCKTYNSLKSDNNPYPKDRVIEYRGINFRSLQERIIAEVLDAFKWDFKYDVTVKIGGTTLSCDFVFMIRELNQMRFLEFFGMMDKEDYRLKARYKMNVYENSGIKQNKNILYLFGDEKESISHKSVAAQLNAIISSQI